MAHDLMYDGAALTQQRFCHLSAIPGFAEDRSTPFLKPPKRPALPSSLPSNDAWKRPPLAFATAPCASGAPVKHENDRKQPDLTGPNLALESQMTNRVTPLFR
jgi:hypothetical protein